MAQSYNFVCHLLLRNEYLKFLEYYYHFVGHNASLSERVLVSMTVLEFACRYYQEISEDYCSTDLKILICVFLCSPLICVIGIIILLIIVTFCPCLLPDERFKKR